MYFFLENNKKNYYVDNCMNSYNFDYYNVYNFDDYDCSDYDCDNFNLYNNSYVDIDMNNKDSNIHKNYDNKLVFHN